MLAANVCIFSCPALEAHCESWKALQVIISDLWPFKHDISTHLVVPGASRQTNLMSKCYWYGLKVAPVLLFKAHCDLKLSEPFWKMWLSKCECGSVLASAVWKRNASWLSKVILSLCLPVLQLMCLPSPQSRQRGDFRRQRQAAVLQRAGGVLGKWDGWCSLALPFGLGCMWNADHSVVEMLHLFRDS